MSKDRDQQNSGGNDHQDFSLEEILLEYRSGPREGPSDDLPWVKPTPKVVPFPSAPAEEPPPPEVDGGAGEPPGLFDDPPPPEDNLVDFPQEESPLQAGLEHLRRKADAYADAMFSEEGVEVSDEVLRVQRLVPGVDLEDGEEELPRRERKPRRPAPPPPDTPPDQLARRFAKGLGLLRLRCALVFLCCLPLLALCFLPLLGLSLPGGVVIPFSLQVWTSGGFLALAMVLGADVVLLGLIRLLLLKPGADTLVSFACALTLADAFTQLELLPQRETLPYAAAAALALFFTMWGTCMGRQGLRVSCKTAATNPTPYLVTLDEAAWNGKDAYAKWSAPAHGFGSQLQEPDLVQRIYRLAAPLFLLAAGLLSLLASLGRDRPEHFLWCLSATLTASAAFSGLLLFSRPFRALARRLSSSGAALPGWSGAGKAGASILLNDLDLFPPGAVSLNGIKVFGDCSVEKVVGVTATLIRDSGCGLEKLFHNLLRTQGAVFKRCDDFTRHEGGGLSGVIRGEQIYVGSASFMALMEVTLPAGLNVRNAVFCAVDGDLAGIFALSYSLHGSIPPALHALISANVSPVLATRDFNLIPAMLRQKFKLPVEKMDFPSVERRAQLSHPDRPHSPRITAVLCREGLAPFSEAVVGVRRLGRAVRLALGVHLLGAVVGLLLAFYLTSVAAYGSLSPAHLTLFLSAWLVPTYLITGWVNRY